MPAYAYEALDADGRAQRGVLEADTARGARNLLRQRALVPLQVRAAAEPGEAASGGFWSRPLTRRAALNTADLTVWTRQLAGLVASGLTIERALGALAQEAETPELQALLGSLRAEVNAGHPLAQALAQHPHTFDETYVAVLAAGEQGGRFALVLERLANDLETRETLRQKLLSALLYPTVVCAIALAIVVFLMSYVVPQVAAVFTQGRHALPLLTLAMIGLSRLLRDWGWLLALLLAGGVGALAWAHTQAPLRARLDALALRLPLAGRLLRGHQAARFAATLALLAEAGVPILKALQTAAQTLSNRALRADALDALTRVREGAPLGSALAEQHRFPRLLATFARLGEQTGQLPAMLQRAADQLGADVQRRALRLVTLLEPLLIVAMGGVVMLIVLAVLMPIMQLNQLVR